MATVVNKGNLNAKVDRSLDRDIFPIVPSDTLKQRNLVQSIYVGISGDIAVKNDLGETVSYTNVPVGQLFVGGVWYVLDTGTDADELVANSSKALR